MEAFFSSSEMRAVRPKSLLIPLCGECKLDKSGCRSPHMKRDGRGEERILIVAEAPGEDEDDVGRPLVGRTGQHLEQVLARVGLNMRRDCWLYNAVICRPPNNDLKSHKKAVEYCRPNVLKTIKELDPEVIILLGTQAVASVIGHLWKEDPGGVTKWAGNTIPSHRPNAWVCPTFHPSFLLRQKDPVLDMMFKEHLAAAADLRGRPWPAGPPDYDGDVTPVLDAEEAARRVRKYRAGLVAVDFENTPLKPDDDAKAEIVTCSVCWEGEETISFPWHGAVKGAVCDLLEDPDVGKIASNMKHEDRWARARLGVTVRGWAWDTMLAAHALDPRGGVTSLKFQAFVRLGMPAYNSHIEPFLIPKEKGGNSPNRVKDISLGMLLKYNGLDSLLEYHVAQHQMKEMGYG